MPTMNQEAEEASAVVQALETLRKRQLHHECAAMNLMLQCAPGFLLRNLI